MNHELHEFHELHKLGQGKNEGRISSSFAKATEDWGKVRENYQEIMPPVRVYGLMRQVFCPHRLAGVGIERCAEFVREFRPGCLACETGQGAIGVAEKIRKEMAPAAVKGHICPECKRKVGYLHNRGKCYTCYRREWEGEHKDEKCKECGVKPVAYGRRGMCFNCALKDRKSMESVKS